MGKSQRVWIISELYFPEITSTGYFLTGLAEGLSSSCSVSVICGQPSYRSRGVKAPSREILNGVDVHRCSAARFDKNRVVGRIVNLVTISFSMSYAAQKHLRRGDIVIAVTNPPLIPYFISAVCLLKQAKFVLLVHDVYPEVFVQLGVLRPGSIFMRAMANASKWVYNTADRIVVLGRDMRNLVLKKLSDNGRQKIIIAPNWGDVEAIYPKSFSTSRLVHQFRLQDTFTIQYLGNIGRTHGIADLARASEILLNNPLFHFLVIGSGAKRKWLEKQKVEMNLSNLTLVNPLKPDELCDGLNACNIAMISFEAGISGISVPSRMYNVLASGKPILAVCDPDSELAEVVREEDVGWVIPPGRPDLIVSTLREAQANPERLEEMGRRARKAAEEKYTLNIVLKTYESLIEGLIEA